jgi:hypothetical protein
MNVFGKRDDERLAMYLVRWVARVMSLAILFLLMLFMFGEDGVNSSVTAAEWTGLAFFPIGVAIGFLIGWKNELMGGIISVASLACFYLIYGLGVAGQLPRGGWFAAFTLPGFLFLFYGLYRLPVFHGKHPTPIVR